jgi:hypothetical protein
LVYLLAKNPARIIIITGTAPKTDDLENENSASQELRKYYYHRNKQKRMNEQSLVSLAALILADLAHANHSPQTRRAYATDLAQLCAFFQGAV